MSAVDELLAAARAAGLEVEERWSLLHDDHMTYLVHSRQPLGSGGEIHERLYIIPPVSTGEPRRIAVFADLEDARDGRRISVRTARSWIAVRARRASC